MPGSLSNYWKKRDFGITSEPRGEVARPGKRLSYVIQKHAASRLHYDFRLELDGTLVSWAVPKGPSLDPHVRRMAVHVEDHPLSYAGFEGVIPKGQYGAGTVEVWDRGAWLPIGDPREGLRKGKLKFEMDGEKLRGVWNLVRINKSKDERQEPWLLIKENDEEARPATEYDIVSELPESVLSKPAAKGRKQTVAKRANAKQPKDAGIPPQAEPAKLPLSFFPQLATLVDEPPAGGGWIYEVKFDGYRVLARIDGGDIRLFTRNGNNWTPRLKALHDELAKLAIGEAWIDGEIAVLDEKGHPSFQLLQGAFDSSRTRDIVFFVFDLPYFGGYDLRRVPCVERRALLRALMRDKASEHVRFSEHFDTDPGPLLKGACEQGLEGLIGKRADSQYVSNRSASWIKLKCTRRQEFVILGYTDPKGSRSGFGSLLLGVHDAQGKLTYAGSVGTGFDDNLLRSLKERLAALATPRPPLDAVPRGVKGHWVKPKLVGEVAFTEWTSDGRIRHPVFHGLRADKDPATITREHAVHAPAAKPAPREKPQPSRKAAAPARERKREVQDKGARSKDVKPPKLTRSMMRPKDAAGGDSVRSIRVTNPDRVIDEASKATKLDLVRYYDRVADHILPHLIQRPVALVRAPGGVTKQLFFQKHGDTVKVPGIKELDRKYWPDHDPMLEIDTRAALVSAAQMNMVELHTWNSTTRAIDKPDRMLFDLDPGEGITWAQLVEATDITHKFLDMLGLESFLKTSGGKGLHIVVPLTPKDGYDTVKDFSQAVVVHLARTLPKLFVAKAGAQNRVGRIFIDYLRNGNGATTAAAFSARARPGLGVSVPLEWKELGTLESASQWNIFSVFDRLDKLRGDPWKGYAKTRQGIAAAAKRLRAAT
jgi:bifunctional non-homologous end joining protein LigD